VAGGARKCCRNGQAADEGAVAVEPSRAGRHPPIIFYSAWYSKADRERVVVSEGEIPCWASIIRDSPAFVLYPISTRFAGTLWQGTFAVCFQRAGRREQRTLRLGGFRLRPPGPPDPQPDSFGKFVLSAIQFLFHALRRWPPSMVLWFQRFGGKLGRKDDHSGLSWLLWRPAKVWHALALGPSLGLQPALDSPQLVYGESSLFTNIVTKSL